jgi:hypothetical protein
LRKIVQSNLAQDYSTPELSAYDNTKTEIFTNQIINESRREAQRQMLFSNASGKL